MAPTAFAAPLALRAPRNTRANYARTPVRAPVRAPRVPRNSPRALVTVGGPDRTVLHAESESRFRDSDGLAFSERAQHLASTGDVPQIVVDTLVSWFTSYHQAVQKNPRAPEDPFAFTESMFSTLLELCHRAIHTPFNFEPYHVSVRTPFDYYKFGFDFASVLVNGDESQVHGMENVREAEEFVRAGHNVVFVSNHQSEADPYAIDSLLDWVAGCDRAFCENMIFMAGDRVRKDPVVAPFSAGRNLLTVYSKRHINDEPELLQEKLLHNRRTIAATQSLFKDGGKAVWFAPSGGRDRRCAISGRIELATFDEGALDMMRFTAQKSGRPCHFYPMSLSTYDMLPPPANIGGAEVGEERVVNHIPVFMAVGEELDWAKSPAVSVKNKMERRKLQRDFVQQIITDGYRAIGGFER